MIQAKATLIIITLPLMAMDVVVVVVNTVEMVCRLKVEKLYVE